MFDPLPDLILDKKRFRVKYCPCGKSNKDGKFVPYVGHDDKGYCHACSQTFLPELKKSEDWNSSLPAFSKPRPIRQQQKPISYIPTEIFKGSHKGYKGNKLVQYLIDLFGFEDAMQLVKKYFIGTSKHWEGATVFWQIDIKGKVRTGKIMLYDSHTGKRVKEPFNHIYWVHKKLDITDYKQCLFGEFLLSLPENKSKPVAIVESEKTALIASVVFPQFVWLAFGGIGFNLEKCSVLKGRCVTLFPDLNGFDDWSNKKTELEKIAIVTVSDYLERNATEAERKGKLDLADYLIKWGEIEERKSELPQKEIIPVALETKQETKTIEPTQTKPATVAIAPENDIVINEHGYPAFWDEVEPVRVGTWTAQIDELEQYFAGIQLPTGAIKLKSFCIANNVSRLVETHIATLRKYDGNKYFSSYLDRLNDLKTYLENNSIYIK
jgi:hypothetical protein